MNFRAVIFDLDGTLANTLEDIADNMNRVLAEKNFPTHPYDAYRYYVGNGLYNLVIQTLPENVRTDLVVSECHSRMLEVYEANYIVKTHLYDGISELLDNLAAQGIKLAVLSNKADILNQKICDVLLKKWKFDAIIGSSYRFPRKPNPEAALFITQQMGVKPKDVCYIGDSNVDMKTAIAAGFFPVGVSWGFRPVAELIENGAKKIINHPNELFEI